MDKSLPKSFSYLPFSQLHYSTTHPTHTHTHKHTHTHTHTHTYTSHWMVSKCCRELKVAQHTLPVNFILQCGSGQNQRYMYLEGHELSISCCSQIIFRYTMYVGGGKKLHNRFLFKKNSIPHTVHDAVH